MSIHLDVRTKVVLLLVAGICTFIVNTLAFEAGLILFFSILQLLSARKVFSWMFVSLYFALVAIQLFLLPVLPGFLAMTLSVPVVSFRKMFPCVMAVILLIKTTKVNEAIATMTKMGMPKAVTITFAVTLRYIPVLGEEWHHIRDAVKIRQLSIRHLGFIQGITKKAECYVVPILLSATKTAENLSAAAITRGIENPSPATCRHYQPMKCQDYLLLTLSAALIVCCIYVKIKGMVQ